MTISSKIAAGLGLMIVLLLAVHAYHVGRMRSLAAASRELSTVQLQAALVAVRQMRLVEDLESTTRKLHATRDPAYARRLDELAALFEANLGELEGLRLSAGEQAAVERLARAWRTMPPPALPPLEADWRPGAAESAALAARRQLLGQLRELAAEVLETNQREVTRKAERSLDASREAQRLSWSLVAAAPVLTVAIGLWAIRSIREPLAQLVRGTRAVAEGDLVVRLDTSRGDEVAHVADAFNAMVRRLGELDQMKKDFLAQVSHELKTPLVAMRETDQLLLDEIAGPLNPKQRRFVELHLLSNRRLSAMISNLLDLARLEAGVVQYDLRSHDLGELLGYVLAELEARLAERRLRLLRSLPGEPLEVRCDGDRIVQVIENLLENAVKHSPRGAAIEVRLGPLYALPAHLPERWRRELVRGGEASRWALLAVIDSGPGIPPEARERIFDKFQQVSLGGPRAKGGVGLGLAICREIVEAHRGALWVTDPPGRGSIFNLLLPALPGGVR